MFYSFGEKNLVKMFTCSLNRWTRQIIDKVQLLILGFFFQNLFDCHVILTIFYLYNDIFLEITYTFIIMSFGVGGG